MCGIAGILHPQACQRQGIVENMLASIAHRGRDAQGIHVVGPLCLGHRRLSIIDLSDTGNQPMSNEDGSIWVVFNGEIYNYLELREQLLRSGHHFQGTSDAEVIPHLYEAYGNAFIGYLSGMFAIALWDQKQQRLILARDRAGKKPLFYASISNGVVFASEMKALFQVPGVDFQVRDQAIADFLSLGAVPGPQTVYRGVQRVPPGHFLVIEEGLTPVVSSYWNISCVPKLILTPEKTQEEFLRLLKESVSLRLRSDVSVGCFLSGGIDSGLVTALAATELNHALNTYTIGFRDQSFDERPLARLVAEQYGTNHHEYLVETDICDVVKEYVTQFDEPFADPSLIPTFTVAKMAAEHTKVILSGDGADEIFGGYRHFVAANLLHHQQCFGIDFARPLFATLAKILPPPTGGRSPYQLLYRFTRLLGASDAERYFILISELFDEREKVEMFPGLFAPAGSAIKPVARLFKALSRSLETFSSLDPIVLNDFHHLLGDVHLVKMDIASMANTLEVRSPFLDYRLIEFGAKLPGATKCVGSRTKPLLRDLAKRLLPREIVEAPKRGFEIPLLRWMKQDLRDMWQDSLASSGSLTRIYCDAKRLEHLLSGKGLDEKRWATIVWSLLCLEIWWSNYQQNLVSKRKTLRPLTSSVGL